MLKVKGRDIYIPPLTGKPEQQQFTIRVAYWPALAVGGAAQFWTRSSSSTDPPMYKPAALWPSLRNVLRQRRIPPATTHHFGSEYYQVVIATHLLTPEGWKAELAW